MHFSADELFLCIGYAICTDHHKWNLSHKICFPICSGSSQSSTLQLVWRRLGFSSSNDYSKPPSASANQPEVVLVGNDLYGSNNSYGKKYSTLSQSKITIHFICGKQIFGYHDRHTVVCLWLSLTALNQYWDIMAYICNKVSFVAIFVC